MPIPFLLSISLYTVLFVLLHSKASYLSFLPLLFVLYFQRYPSTKHATIDLLSWGIVLLLTFVLLFILALNPVFYFIDQAAWISFLFVLIFALHRQDLSPQQEEVDFSEEILPQQRIAGGLAHEFNNHLMVLYGNIELLRYSPAENHASYFERFELAFELSKQFTLQMLYYSGRSTISPIFTLHLSELLSEVISINPLLENWELQVEEEFSFSMDKEQLRRSFTLLLEKLSNNTRQQITIRSFRSTEDTHWLFSSDSPTTGLEIQFSLPEGHPQTIRELFTPYHTKNIGSFRIGLPYAGEILRQHNAAIGQSETLLHVIFPYMEMEDTMDTATSPT